MSAQPSILQFGTSRFLLGHADFFISEALENDRAIGTVAIVQTTNNPDSAKRIEALNSGEGYPVIIRGLSNGQPIDKQYQTKSVSAAYIANRDWETIRQLATSVKAILSNTADKGYLLNDADDASLIDNPHIVPASFPAKLLVLLYNRWEKNPSEPLSIFPCELISRNGDILRKIVLQLAQEWKLPADFVTWMNNQCVFANSLVDRIVSEPIDPVGAIAEPYALWAIEKAPGLTLPCEHPDIVLTDNLTVFEQLKLYILNLGHTFIAEQWLKDNRPKEEIVLEAMQDKSIRDELEAVWREEVIPIFIADGLEKEAQEYVVSVRERFLNPFLKHRIADIASNHEEKKQRRFAPVIARAGELGLNLPQARLKKALGMT